MSFSAKALDVLKRGVLVAVMLATTGCALLRDYSRVEDEPVAVTPSVNLMARGDSAYEREEFAQAAVWYREAARAGQQEAVAWYNAANAMVRLDLDDEAAEAYRRSLRVAPGFVKAHQNLAALHHLAGETVEAARHYEAAARLDGTDANSRYRLGEQAQEAGDRGEALYWYEQALDVDSLHEAAASASAQVHLDAGDTAAALVGLDRYNARAARAGAARAWALMLQGDLSVALGQREEGLRLYQDAALVVPGDARPWLRMARALREGGRLLEAGVALTQGLAADSGRGELWAALGAMRFEAGDPAGARTAFARAFHLGSVEGVQGLEMLAAWHERRHETTAAQEVRDMLGIQK